MSPGLMTTALAVAVGCLIAALGLSAGGVRGLRLAGHALGFGPGLGLGVASLVLFFGRLVHGNRPGLGWFLLVAGLVAAGTVLVRKRSVSAAAPAARPNARLPTTVSATMLLALLLAATSMLVSFWSLSRLWPDGTWDAVAIWNVRARFFYHGYDRIPDLLKSVEPTSHPHYPLLLPGAVAAQYAFAGKEDPLAPEAVALAFLAALGLLAFAVVADSGLPAFGAVAAALLWGTPMVVKWGASQCSDVAVGYYFLGSVAVLASQLPGRESTRLPPLLGGVFLGLLAWTKNEGILIVLLLLVLYGLWSIRRGRGRERWRPLVGFALGAVPGIAAVFLFKALWAPESGLTTFLQGRLTERILSLERWWLPVREILRRLIPVSGHFGWQYVWPVMELGIALACWVHWRARKSWASFWGAVVLATVASWVPLYVVTPYDQMWHLSGSLDRLLLQLFPVVVAGVLLRLGGAVADGGAAKEKAV